MSYKLLWSDSVKPYNKNSRSPELAHFVNSRLSNSLLGGGPRPAWDIRALFVIYNLVCCLLADPWIYGKYVFLPYVRLIKLSSPPFRYSASSLIFQYLLLFFKPSRSSILLLPTPLTSIICSSITSLRRWFLLKTRPTQLAFLRRILFRSFLFSPIRSRTSSLVTFWDHFYLLHSFPESHFKALQTLPLQCS